LFALTQPEVGALFANSLPLPTRFCEGIQCFVPGDGASDALFLDYALSFEADSGGGDEMAAIRVLQNRRQA
jgi:hypothetical protein